MSNNATDELLSYINTILADYAATCGVEPFNGQIIIADDMRKSYLSLRGDKASENAQYLNDIQRYHGLTVQPSSGSDTFTILLNKDYILGQGFLHMIQNVVNTDTVVQDFHQVGDFHRFKGNGHLAFFEDGFHLLAGQTVACHPARTVGQIGLDIVVQPMEVFLLFLTDQLLCQRR